MQTDMILFWMMSGKRYTREMYLEEIKFDNWLCQAIEPVRLTGNENV